MIVIDIKGAEKVLSFELAIIPLSKNFGPLGAPKVLMLQNLFNDGLKVFE